MIGIMISMDSIALTYLSIRGELDIKSCIINLLELSPIMKLLFIPLPLVLLQVKSIHARLANLVVCRAPFDYLPLVTVIQLEVVIAEARLPIETGSNIREEGRERCHVQSASELSQGNAGIYLEGKPSIFNDIFIMQQYSPPWTKLSPQ